MAVMVRAGLGEGVAVGEAVGMAVAVAVGLGVLVSVAVGEGAGSCGVAVDVGSASAGRGEVGDDWGVTDGSWEGVLVGVGRPSGGSGDGWGVADGSSMGVLVGVGNSPVGCVEVGDGCGVGVVGTGVKVRVGTVWRCASWPGAAHTPDPKDNRPMTTSPMIAKTKELQKGLRLSKGFLRFGTSGKRLLTACR